MSIPVHQTESNPAFSFRLTETALARIAKLAAVLFALYYAYFLKTGFLHYATEPKVIGGISLDRDIPQTMLWSPIYYPLLLSALFAYWIWPTRPTASLIWLLLRGFFALFLIQLFSLFVSLLCPHLGGFYLELPSLMPSEILPSLVTAFIAAAATAALMGLFMATPLIGNSAIIGCAMALTGDAASRYLLRDEACSGGPGSPASPSWFSQPLGLWPWPALVAGLIASAIMLAGMHSMGFAIFTFWTEKFIKVAIPCIALGAVFGSITRHWEWCVAASLPIGYFLSTSHYGPSGMLASQSLDFPAVLIAVSVGFVFARKVVSRILLRKSRIPGAPAAK